MCGISQDVLGLIKTLLTSKKPVSSSPFLLLSQSARALMAYQPANASRIVGSPYKLSLTKISTYLHTPAIASFVIRVSSCLKCSCKMRVSRLVGISGTSAPAVRGSAGGLVLSANGSLESSVVTFLRGGCLVLGFDTELPSDAEG